MKIIKPKSVQSIIKGFPDMLQIEPTTFCNAKCPLCPTGTGTLLRPKAMLPFELYKKVIDESISKIREVVLFNYGEPFLHPQIFEMINYISNESIEIRTSTNGTPFCSIDSIKALSSSRLDTLIVSINGFYPVTHAIYQRKSSLTKIKSGLKTLVLLKQKRLRIIIQMLAMKHNEPEIELVKEFAASIGVEFNLKSINLDMVKGKVCDKLNFLPSKPYSPNRYFVNSGNYELKQKYLNYCPEIEHSLLITAGGTVSPCCYDFHGEICFGDIRTETIHNIWNGEKVKKFREIIATSQNQINICEKCPTALRKTDHYRKKF